MKSLIEQSEAYWTLGMINEARALAKEALAEERDAAGADTTGPAAVWCIRLAYRNGEFESAAARGLREPRFPAWSDAIQTIALCLHYLGRHDEAAEFLAPRARAGSHPGDRFQLACFLSKAGKAEEAVEELFHSLARYRNERGETWMDGDLKTLWATLAKGNFSLATAHRLVEWEFDFLREWQPGCAKAWSLDPTHFNDLPTGLRTIFEPVPRWGEHRIVPGEAKAAPALVERFEQWMPDEIAASQRAFDTAREIALRRVLDAQPAYAEAAWKRNDVCALRNHVHWTARHDPARLGTFAQIAGIGPLLDEVGRMIASDAEFFAKLDRAAIIATDDTEEAFEIIESLPAKWSNHPLILLHRGYALVAGCRYAEALPLLLRVCSQWPDDASGFLHAAWAAIKAEMQPGCSEVIKAVRANAPPAARRYRGWTGMEGWLSWAGDYSPMSDFETKSRPFRGQPDLGGHLSVEIKPPTE